MKTRELVLISVAFLVLSLALFFWMNGSGPSDLGSLLGAASGLIAIMWFYRGLRLQSIQINEQKNQFVRQFNLQHQDSQLAFLESASERMKTHLSDLISNLEIDDEAQVLSAYMSNMQFYKQALESTDPYEVLTNIKDWMKIEGPCRKFMMSIQDIVVLFKLRLGMEDDSEEADAAEYVHIQSGYLMKQPFMSPFKITVQMLSQQMNLLSPGRNAMYLASSAAMALTVPEGIMKIDKIIHDIDKAKKEKKLVPEICNTLIANQRVHSIADSAHSE